MERGGSGTDDREDGKSTFCAGWKISTINKSAAEEDNCEFMVSIEIVIIHAGASHEAHEVTSVDWREKSKGETFGYIFERNKKTDFFFTSSRHSVQGQSMLRAAFISFSPSIAQ